MSGQTRSFHEPSSVKIASVASAGFASGSTIRKNTCQAVGTRRARRPPRARPAATGRTAASGRCRTRDASHGTNAAAERVDEPDPREHHVRRDHQQLGRDHDRRDDQEEADACGRGTAAARSRSRPASTARGATTTRSPSTIIVLSSHRRMSDSANSSRKPSSVSGDGMNRGGNLLILGAAMNDVEQHLDERQHEQQRDRQRAGSASR